MLQTLSKTIKGTLTIIAHDSVTDWLNGGATNRALTLMLEVKAPDGSKQILAATYQDLASPTDPPQALGNVVSIDMDELAVKNLAGAVNGLLFAQPESTIAPAAADAVRLDRHAGDRRGEGQQGRSRPTTPATTWPRCCASR